MKRKSGSQFAFFNLRVLAVLFVFLTGVFLALLGPGAFSHASGQVKRSPGPLPSHGNVASRYDNARYLDDRGYRPNGVTFERPRVGRGHGTRIATQGTWSSLGPPGGDVFDVAVSTVNPDLVLAGIAPGGGFGGTLYRSSDGGRHMV